MLLTDMDKACARILDAIDREETIVVFGDYDVDGVTATALLYQHLKGGRPQSLQGFSGAGVAQTGALHLMAARRKKCWITAATLPPWVLWRT